jgi:hypothetical protein
MTDLQIAMRDPKIARIRATRRFGAFAVLTLRTIEKIRTGKMTAAEAARHTSNRWPGPTGCARNGPLYVAFSPCKALLLPGLPQPRDEHVHQLGIIVAGATTSRGRRREVLSESRMREIFMSGCVSRKGWHVQ